MRKIKVLHITPHLGGGVGRALSDHSIYRKMVNSRFDEKFICLERAQKTHFIDKMIANGVDVFVEPEDRDILSLIDSSDIVQIEWWHHPLMDKWLSEHKFSARLSMWSHTSGLHYPAIPHNLIEFPHLFMFTSHASMPKRSFKNLVVVANSVGNIGVIYNKTQFSNSGLPSAYIGSLNFAKLHPDIEYLTDIDGLLIDMFGDPKDNKALKSSKHINICGFTNDPYKTLCNYDSFIYLLNPEHYGTTENALLEAMTFGCIPIVMNNPVESSIVRDGHTGYVIKNKLDLEDRIGRLNSDMNLRRRMSSNASVDIGYRFDFPTAVKRIDTFYEDILGEKKREFDFSSIFGNTPYDIFMSCLGSYSNIFDAGSTEERRKHYFLYEANKSSAFHFNKYFPNDTKLNLIVSMLEEDVLNGISR